MQDKRKYIRLNSIFPVEFSLYFTPQNPISPEYEGFTFNVSEGGLCITARNLRLEDAELILRKKVGLKLTIHMPLHTKAVNATAEVAWSKKEENPSSRNTYAIGLSYRDIKEKDRKRIINYARRLKWMPRIASAVLSVLLIVILALSFNHIKVKRENEELIKHFVSVSEVKSNIEKQLNEIKVRKEMLEQKSLSGGEEARTVKGEIKDIEEKTAFEKGRLTEELNRALAEQESLRSAIAKLSLEKKFAQDMAQKGSEVKLGLLNNKISALEMELTEVAKKSEKKTALLQDKLDSLQEESALFKDEMFQAEQGKISLEAQLAKVRIESGELEKASINTMVGWIKTHRTKKTGLVLSYEGDKDIKDWGFTYDEALACQVFLISGDIAKASAVLNFYKNTAIRSDGLFYNAYDVKTGMPSEYAVHSGPNIWIAISACQYSYRTKDSRFLMFAENIATAMIRMQKASNDGSIKGGPDTDWVSTEHNLDAYALFNMLYELTKKGVYKEAASTTLLWLKDVGYNKPEGRFMRGKGDATIATDTFSWAIAAIGPDTLKANGMDPDGIMEFAENECRVQVKFIRPEGRVVEIDGFDFAKAKNLGRGGVVSTEWTAQMVEAFNIMADYYSKLNNKEKEGIYRFKAQYYLAQLGKMVISSPSPTGQGHGCLPYASKENVDTGHGWRVAKGNRTGSVSATAYYIFAYKHYNPLSFKILQYSPDL